MYEWEGYRAGMISEKRRFAFGGNIIERHIMEGTQSAFDKKWSVLLKKDMF